MATFADQIISYNNSLDFGGTLPLGISFMNPYKDSMSKRISEEFYRKFYSDNRERKLIIGINPGRFGGGITGVPFTDPKRLIEKCGIAYEGKLLHEQSSVFMYEMIEAYGGAHTFYSDFYFNSLCPLGLIRQTEEGKEVNYNYYDTKELQNSVSGFIIWNLKELLKFNVNREVCFCLGTGQNTAYFIKLNQESSFFKKIISLEHPRFIMQYKAKSKQEYINKYIDLLSC